MPLENALRSNQLQYQPIGVTAGSPADRLAHQLHVEEIRRPVTHAQLRRERPGNMASGRQPGPDRAESEKPTLLARVDADADIGEESETAAGFILDGQARIQAEREIRVHRHDG